MTLFEEKQALRREVRSAERALDTGYKAAADRAILGHILELPLYRAAARVFCFVSTGNEVDTRPLLADALAAGKTLCVPRCREGGRMDVCRIQSLAELAPGAYGILEPGEGCATVSAADIGFALIPCLSADRRGRRLGRGGGYYDRFLEDYRGAAVLVCREALLREHIPMEAHDVVLPWVVTERGVFPGESAAWSKNFCLD